MYICVFMILAIKTAEGNTNARFIILVCLNSIVHLMRACECVSDILRGGAWARDFEFFAPGCACFAGGSCSGVVGQTKLRRRCGLRARHHSKKCIDHSSITRVVQHASLNSFSGAPPSAQLKHFETIINNLLVGFRSQHPSDPRFAKEACYT